MFSLHQIKTILSVQLVYDYISLHALTNTSCLTYILLNYTSKLKKNKTEKYSLFNSVIFYIVIQVKSPITYVPEWVMTTLKIKCLTNVPNFTIVADECFNKRLISVGKFFQIIFLLFDAYLYFEALF